MSEQNAGATGATGVAQATVNYTEAENLKKVLHDIIGITMAKLPVSKPTEESLLLRTLHMWIPICSTEYSLGTANHLL